MRYSVLMSVYKKEEPDFLRRSMQSIYDQTVPTDDFVLICDGELTGALDEVIKEMQKKFGKRLNVIRRDKNYGLGATLAFGVEKCKNDIVARMDSDDVSRKDRCEKELNILNGSDDISVVGSFVAEFEESPEKLKSVRKVPEKHGDILKFARFRSPINHPSVMFKKQDILAVGGYQAVRYCQDYYLWEKMLANGYRFYNVQDTLVYMYENSSTFKRRSGKQYFAIQKQLFKQMKADGLIAFPQYCAVVTARFFSTFSPNWLRKVIFTRFMREKIH